MEELEIQYSQALAKPKRETISHNSLLEAIAFKASGLPSYVRYYAGVPMDGRGSLCFVPFPLIVEDH